MPCQPPPTPPPPPNLGKAVVFDDHIKILVVKISGDDHARACGGSFMTLGSWLMARDDMGCRSPNRPDFPSRTGILEQAPAAGAGVALVYW
ncbi:hypothetical protein FHETE_6512 [Fusarium heterosporum]|uniref:Uncharacterized protein n=1 Tax=Fusarium heterosporum TaxID=42747 RepID=A0A8H5T9Y0_FUSHE|nr:hypothetical protein FHETE_6512 [Fusarium heterosporum]